MSPRTWIEVPLLLCLFAAPVVGETISAAEAKNHIAEKATVCGKIANEHTAVNSRGTPTFLDLDSAYPSRVFTIIIWGNDREAVGALPAVGSRICVSGLIENYHGTPQIAVWSREQIE